MRNTELFEQYWNKFITRLRGKLISQSAEKELTFPVAKLILLDSAGDWATELDEGGRWLIRELTAQDRNAAEKVRQVLESMSFVEPEVSGNLPEVMDYAVPVVGAAVGAGIAVLADAGTIAKVASTVVPAVALYPATKQVRTMVNNKKSSDKVDAYMAQMDVYRDEILAILNGAGL